MIHHFVQDMPIRVSALRTLGAYANVFALESFMDELAAAAGASGGAMCSIVAIRATRQPK